MEAKNSIRSLLQTSVKKLSGRDLISEDSEAFIQKPMVRHRQQMESIPNTYTHNNVTVEVGTVHSVKGETHSATLYMETYFHQDGRGVSAKSYESQRLIEELAGVPITTDCGKRKKESARVMYVGFSRPTHLLCFAAHKDRIATQVQRLRSNGWVVIDDLIQQIN